MVHQLNKKILIILPVFGDTKDSKRIMLLTEAGFEVNVAFFERNSYVARIPIANSFIKLGKISDGNYFKRIIVFIFAMFKLRKLVKKNDIIYCIGADLAMLYYFSSLGINRRFIIDVADIRPIQVEKTVLGKIIRLLEALITKKCSLLVVTSQGFIEHYYINVLKITKLNYFLLENKVDYNISINLPQNFLKEKKIVLGYFGVIRDGWTLVFLRNLVSKFPQKFECIIAGINALDELEFDELTNKSKGIRYLGPYKSPDDLGKIYSLVDVILIFYPDYNSSQAWFEAKKICKSNRFYEALYFKKPIVSFTFSEDGKDVERFKIGFNLDDYDIGKAINFFNNAITDENLDIWKSNLSKIDAEVFQFINESGLLEKKIRELLN